MPCSIRGHEVRVPDSLRRDVHHGRAPALGAELLVGDVRDADLLDRALTGIEAVVHLAAKVGLGRRSAGLRIVYGPGMPRDTAYAGVAAIFVSALCRGESPQVFEDGGQRRDFIHVREIASATVVACEKHTYGIRAFNVGSGSPRTVGDMATALPLARGGPSPEVTGAFRLGDVRHITADSSRLRNELNWNPQVDFEAGMTELARR